MRFDFFIDVLQHLLIHEVGVICDDRIRQLFYRLLQQIIDAYFRFVRLIVNIGWTNTWCSFIKGIELFINIGFQR